MTKDEDDWLADFIEVAQATARQSQIAAEKEYGTKLKLFAARFERARGCDADEELAKRLAASEALAGLRKFDAASDALDEAWKLSGGLLSAAAMAAAETAEAVLRTAAPPASEVAEPEIAPADEPAVPMETPVEEVAVEDADESLDQPLADAPPDGEASAPVADESASVVETAEPAAVDEFDTEALLEEAVAPAEEPAAEIASDIPEIISEEAPADLPPADDPAPAEEASEPAADESPAEATTPSDDMDLESLLAEEPEAAAEGPAVEGGSDDSDVSLDDALGDLMADEETPPASTGEESPEKSDS